MTFSTPPRNSSQITDSTTPLALSRAAGIKRAREEAEIEGPPCRSQAPSIPSVSVNFTITDSSHQSEANSSDQPTDSTSPSSPVGANPGEVGTESVAFIPPSVYRALFKKSAELNPMGIDSSNGDAGL